MKGGHDDSIGGDAPSECSVTNVSKRGFPADAVDLKWTRAPLISWYLACKRDLPWRRTKDPYHIWVSEVMLQQTQVAAVIPYYLKFSDRFPDIFRLAGADLQDVLMIWEGMGYYARARNLHKAAGIVVNRHRGRIPDDPAAFRSLPGVGDYIAAAVLSIAFDRPLPVVDGNVKRVLARLMKVGAPVNKTSSYKIFHNLAAAMLDHDDPGTFNQAVMELGALVCRPKNPDCRACPLSGNCRAHQDEAATSYPVREIKPPVPERRQAVGVVFRGSRVLIVRRPENGLLGGLWEFPSGDIDAGESPEAACVRIMQEKAGLDVTVTSLLTQVRHTYTHFRLRAHVFVCADAGQSESPGASDDMHGPGSLTGNFSEVACCKNTAKRDQWLFKENDSILMDESMVAEIPIGFNGSGPTGATDGFSKSDGLFNDGTAAWVELRDLDRYPFHRANRKFMPLLMNAEP